MFSSPRRAVGPLWPPIDDFDAQFEAFQTLPFVVELSNEWRERLLDGEDDVAMDEGGGEEEEEEDQTPREFRGFGNVGRGEEPDEEPDSSEEAAADDDEIIVATSEHEGTPPAPPLLSRRILTTDHECVDSFALGR